MKKITTLLLLFVTALIIMTVPAYAEEVIDVYPYGNINNMTENEPIVGGTQRVGTSNWTLEFLGYRYHFVRSAVRYGHDFIDENSDGKYDTLEYPGVSYSAFAAMTINNTEDDLELSTTNLRANITAGITNRIYAYFDANMELAMFEDHIYQYYIHNDGSDALYEADWRFATEAEIAAFDASEEPLVDTPNTRFAHVRVLKDDTDAQGYVLEPIGYTIWTNPDLAALAGEDEVPVAEQSLLVDWNPNHVFIPAGWSVVSFGQWDRSTTYPLANDFVQMLYTAFLAEEAPVAVATYHPQKPVFAGLTSQDDDAVTPGIQMIVEFNQIGFNLPNSISASWLKMYDDDSLVNDTEKLSYKVDIYDSADFYSVEEDHMPTILETITFVYDSEEDTYTPDKAVSVIDSSVFGAGYVALYSSETPVGDVEEVAVQIAVGVLPPRFENVRNRFVDEGVFVDLLGNITANDGYGNDKTDDIQISTPAGFNMYNPKPGTYKIDLEFTHNVFIAGDPTVLTIGTTDYDIDITTINQSTNVSVLDYGRFAIFTDQAAVRAVGSGYGSVFLVAAADGTLKEWYDRYNWNHMTSTGITVGNEVLFNAWRTALVLEEGEFVVAMHGGTNTAGLRNLAFGHPLSLEMGTFDFERDIVTPTSYMLTVDDRTAPQLVVVDNNYTIEADRFANAQAAILSNVVAIDNFDTRSQLSLYVAATGGLAVSGGRLVPGTYTVIVGVEDRAGNSDEVSFTITVRPARLTQEEIEQAIEERVEEVEAQIPQDTITPEQVDAAIEQAIEDALASYDGVGVLTAVLMSLGAALVSFGGAALLFFLKKK